PGRDVSRPHRGHRAGHAHARNHWAGAEDRRVHRIDAALRHSGTGPHRSHRPGPRRSAAEGGDVIRDVVLPTRTMDPKLQQLLAGLKPGQRIRVTQTVRVGDQTWTTTVEGVYRDVNYLATGLSTSRVPEDDLVVPAVHFTKDNGELSSITLDEKSKIEVI